jgi:prepilin signal peptidase PulO-like enzyme (type II secretory pathway)
VIDPDTQALKLRFLAPTLIGLVAIVLVSVHRYLASTILGVLMLIASLVWIGVFISQERRR